MTDLHLLRRRVVDRGMRGLLAGTVLLAVIPLV